MSDFRTEARVDLVVPDRETDKIRSTIEAAAADVPATIDAAADGGAGSGGGTSAQRRRELLSEGIDLDVRRNELLEQLLTVTEEGDFSRANRSGGSLGLLAGGAAVIGSALAGITSAVSNFSLDAPDLSPGNLIGSAATVGAADVVGSSATVGAADVVSSPAAITASNVIGAAATVGASALISSGAAVTASALISSQASVGAGDLIGEVADITPGALIDAAATVGVGALISSTAAIAAADLVSSKANVSASDVVSGPISAGALIAAIVGTGTALGAGAAAATGKLGSGGGPGGGAPAGAGAGGIGFPAIPALLGREGARAKSKDPEDRNIVEEFLADLTPDLGQGRRQQALEAQTGQQIEQSAGGVQRAQPANETQVEVTTNVEGTGGISEREAERIAERKAEEVRREIERKIDQ